MTAADLIWQIAKVTATGTVGIGAPYFFMKPGLWRGIMIALNATALIASLANLSLIAWDNWRDGCFNAPADVQFHQGMTLCPGQTAHGAFVVMQPDGRDL